MDAALINCGAFVPLAVTGKWSLHTRRVSRMKVKALVTSSIIKSVCLVGNGGVEGKVRIGTAIFFSFKKSAKTSAD